MQNDQNIHIVALKDDKVSNTNINTGIANNLWGMQRKGKHVGIKKGDLVIFLLGISINNLDLLKNDPAYTDRFPNFKDSLLSNKQFMSRFVFNANKVLTGIVDSDYFEDSTVVWPPYVNKAGKSNFFTHRFKWHLLQKGNNIEFPCLPNSFKFHVDIVRALRDKGAQPSQISLSDFDLVKSRLSEIEQADSEEYFQNAVSTAKVFEIADGPRPIDKQQRKRHSHSWPRSPSITSSALRRAAFKCEISSKHLTFLNPKTGYNFVEGHHIIPIGEQGAFEFSLDVPENIMSLCPNCHRAFHHGNSELKNELLRKAFTKRAKGLADRGLHFSLEELVRYYE